MSDLNEKPGEAMAAGVAKATASQTSFAGRIRNYFLTSLVFLARWAARELYRFASGLGAASQVILKGLVCDSRRHVGNEGGGHASHSGSQ
jgi:hypothetical protein